MRRIFRPDIFRTCCKIHRCVEIMTLRPSGRSGESNRNLTASLASTTDRKIAFSRDYCSDHLPQLMEIMVRPWRSRDVLRAVQWLRRVRKWNMTAMLSGLLKCEESWFIALRRDFEAIKIKIVSGWWMNRLPCAQILKFPTHRRSDKSALTRAVLCIAWIIQVT